MQQPFLFYKEKNPVRLFFSSDFGTLYIMCTAQSQKAHNS